MKITILGCGGSNGVPQIGCECSVCTSTDPKNNRTRASIFIEIDNFKILVDAGPDLRSQCIREGIDYADMILTTHAHYDHIGGIGDLRCFNKGNCSDIYSDPYTAKALSDTFPYAFKSNSIIYPAILKQHIFEGSFSSVKSKVEIIPFKQSHGKSFSYGFRIGDFAYSTDVNYLDANAHNILDGVKVWVVSCIRFGGSPTHFCLDDSIAAILKVKPESAILTHMSHDVDYSLLSKVLPRNINLAYDGMQISI